MKILLSCALAATALGQDAWSERMGQANKLQGQGRYAEARQLYEAAVADTPTQDRRHPQALNNLAAHFYELGKYHQAEPLYRQAMDQWRARGETGRLGIVLSNLATLYRKTGRYTEAINYFTDASGALKQAYGTESPEIVSCYVNWADVYRITGRLQEAEDLAGKAVQISEKVFTPEDGRLSHSLHAYASILQSSGRGSSSIPLHERALAIREKTFGPAHSYVAASLTALVSQYLESGEYELAEPLAQRALEIWRARLGTAHPNTAIALNNVAQVYRFQQKYAEAEPLYRRSIEILENSPEVVKPLGNFADFLVARGRPNAALALYQRSEEISRASLGATHPQTLDLQMKIARVFEATGRKTEAARLLKQVRQAPPVPSF